MALAFGAVAVGVGSVIGAIASGVNESDRIESNERISMRRQQIRQKKKRITMKRKLRRGEVVEEEISIEYFDNDGDGDDRLIQIMSAMANGRAPRRAVAN